MTEQEREVNEIDDESISSIISGDNIDVSVTETETETTETTEQTETTETTETEPVEQTEQTEQPETDVDASVIEFQKAQQEKLLAESREKLAQFFNAQNNSGAVHEPTQHDRPNPQDDMIGWMQYVDRMMHEDQQMRQQMMERQQQAQREQEFAKQIDTFYRTSMKAAEHTKPDINQAVDYLYDLRANEMRKIAHLYPDLNDDAVVDQRIGMEYRDIVIACAQRGLDPADELYKMALARGYKSQTKPKLSELQRKQTSAKSLTGSAGKSGDDAMSLEWIDSLSEDEMMDLARTDEKRYNQIKKMLASA